jgi:hypothetical protein
MELNMVTNRPPCQHRPQADKRLLSWFVAIAQVLAMNSAQAKALPRQMPPQEVGTGDYSVDVLIVPESANILAERTVQVTITARKRVEIDAVILDPGPALTAIRSDWQRQKQPVSQKPHSDKIGKEILHDPTLEPGGQLPATFILPTGWKTRQLLSGGVLGFDAKDYPVTIIVEGSVPPEPSNDSVQSPSKDLSFTDRFPTEIACQAVLPLVLLGGFAGGALYTFWPLLMRKRRGEALESWQVEIQTAIWNGLGGAFITLLLVEVGPYISNLNFGFKIAVTSASSGLVVGLLSYAMTEAVDKFLRGKKPAGVRRALGTEAEQAGGANIDNAAWIENLPEDKKGEG